MLATSTLALLGAGGTAYFAAVFALLHLLDPATDAVGRAGSEYVLGPYGILMTSCYLALAGAVIALAIAYARMLGGRAAPALLLLAGVGLVIAAMFPTDRGVVATTVTGTIHNFAGLGTFIAVLIAVISLTRATGKDPRFSGSGRWLGVLSLCAVASFAVLFLVSGPFVSLGIFGIAQRLFLACVSAWLVVAALQLRAAARPGPAAAMPTLA